jgi:hypothetical protein
MFRAEDLMFPNGKELRRSGYEVMAGHPDKL